MIRHSYIGAFHLTPLHAVAMFVALIGSAIAASLHSYQATARHMVADMNQALELTLRHKQEAYLTPDTITDYRRHLKTDLLRTHSIIYYAMDDRQHDLRSKPMVWRADRRSVRFQGYANCSTASILMASDQSLPLSLLFAAALWALAAMHYSRNGRHRGPCIGQLTLCTADGGFYDTHDQPVRFTPMQQQLMTMFFDAPQHTLSKQHICDALWPKKPDASETLYTLIRRTRTIIAHQCELNIVSDRGRSYRLEHISEAHPANRRSDSDEAPLHS